MGKIKLLLVIFFLGIFSAFSMAQEITGKVTDENGAGLPGANVTIKGTTEGTVTNLDGEYSITVGETSDILVFSFIGYLTQEHAVAGLTVIDVQLEPGAYELAEVVAVGYGTMRRADLTGSVVSVRGDVIAERPLTNLNTALIGQMAGVSVELNDATPGGLTSVKIRGAGSISAGNEPLYVIDGYPVSQLEANSLLPADIASIDVLKDASSTAIYGSRGANGVILINTKSGANMTPRFNLDVSYGIANVAKRDYYDLLDADEYVEFIGVVKEELYVRDGFDPSVPMADRPIAYQIPDYVKNRDPNINTDWQDVIFEPANMKNYAMSVRGGNDRSKYYVSMGYAGDEGVVVGSDYEKYTARVKIDANLIDNRLTAGFNLSPSFANKRMGIINQGDVFSSVIGSAIAMPPIVPVYNDDGTYGSTAGIPGLMFYGNPLQLAKEYEDNYSLFTSMANSYLDLSIIEGLNLRTSFGFVFNNTTHDVFRPESLWRPFDPAPSYADGSSSYNNGINWLSETTLGYTKTFSDVHNINLMAGLTAQKDHGWSNYMYANNFPNDLVTTLNAGEVQRGNSDISEWSLLSYLGRVNYSYDDRYLITGTLRVDGSSRFGMDNRYGTFPSAAIAWRVSEESFLENSVTISNLKLRASYGMTGNNAIGNYAHIGLVGNTNQTFGMGAGSNFSGIYPTTIGNPGFSWEVSRQFDIGMDLGLFRQRISLVLDYYNNHTSDLLLNVNLPTTTGFSSVLQNIGEVENKGYEISLFTRNIEGKFKWSTGFNISYNHNEVLKLGPNDDPIFDFYGTRITEIGEEIGATNGLEVIGVLTQADIDAGVAIFPGEFAGWVKWRDVDGDGVISNFNGPDGINIGNPFPDYTFGMSNMFTYENFDLSIFLNGQTGGRTLDLVGQGMWSSGGNNIFKNWYENRYISDNEPGDGETPTLTFGLGGLPDTRLLQKTDFIRITNVTLGYNLPTKNISYLSGFRIYVSVENLTTWDRFDGYNPQQKSLGAEQKSTLGGFALGGAYPLPRTISFGLNLSF
ncbi:MAG: TonB-dependent receptor [Bacteroidales bacterium]|nr:TonB-dependent receptor [Bacteroidales bacterium]